MAQVKQFASFRLLLFQQSTDSFDTSATISYEIESFLRCFGCATICWMMIMANDDDDYDRVDFMRW